MRGRLRDEREEYKEKKVRNRLAEIACPAEREAEGLREDPEADEDIPNVVVAVVLEREGKAHKMEHTHTNRPRRHHTIL